MIANRHKSVNPALEKDWLSANSDLVLFKGGVKFLYHIYDFNQATGAVIVEFFAGCKFHLSLLNCINGVITADADTDAGPELATSLTNNYVARDSNLATRKLDAQAL